MCRRFDSVPSHHFTILYIAAVVAKWLTHQIVALAFVGSIPINRPMRNAGVV
ncbi:hypothetical protein EMIT013CA1_180004 [Bacillus sp. IT-13CA1]